MPELAEVEFYRRQWEPGVGQTVSRVLTHPKARIFRDIPAVAVERGLKTRQFVASHAHGKQMMFEFSDGAWLGLHLGMTGKLHAASIDHEPEKHDHLVVALESVALVFTDTRMFGKLTLDLTDDGESPTWWRDLPLEVLDKAFTKKKLATFVARFPRTPLKTLLLDQRGFPGIGNWMADEICWRMEVPPQTLSCEITSEEIDKLWKITRKVSRDALRVIGTDWSDPPKSWLFNHRWKDGGNCPCCGSELERADLRGRTTCWCPVCQAQESS